VLKKKSAREKKLSALDSRKRRDRPRRRNVWMRRT
jgi:hypothetical protein